MKQTHLLYGGSYLDNRYSPEIVDNRGGSFSHALNHYRFSMFSSIKYAVLFQPAHISREKFFKTSIHRFSFLY